ncbi:MAG: hypothetical protein KatS3mg111_4292 [Pirellulaceae bacterium]|nr:MAG: hypothetical protein KatS3mg111_4292 [Pirellulaceae bacterium]
MTAYHRHRRFLDPGVVARLRSLPLCSRKPMLGSVSGMHVSPHRGASVEFAEYRRYVAGDDLRRLDWRAFGRTDRFYIKEFEADTNLRLVFILDTSGSMAYGSTGLTKLQYAERLVATLAYLAVAQGDAVGLTCIADRVIHQLPPRRHPGHLSLLFDMLETLRPHGTTALIKSLHELAATLRQRALVILLSDLFTEPESLRSCMEHFRFCQHDVAVFHLLDPEEVDFTVNQPTRFLDLEGGEAVFSDPAEMGDRYRAAVRAYLDSMETMMRETAIDYHRVQVDQPYEQTLTRFLLQRVHRRRRR